MRYLTEFANTRQDGAGAQKLARSTPKMKKSILTLSKCSDDIFHHTGQSCNIKRSNISHQPEIIFHLSHAPPQGTLGKKWGRKILRRAAPGIHTSWISRRPYRSRQSEICERTTWQLVSEFNGSKIQLESAFPHKVSLEMNFLRWLATNDTLTHLPRPGSDKRMLISVSSCRAWCLPPRDFAVPNRNILHNLIWPVASFLRRLTPLPRLGCWRREMYFPRATSRQNQYVALVFRQTSSFIFCVSYKIHMLRFILPMLDIFAHAFSCIIYFLLSAESANAVYDTFYVKPW